MFIWIVNTAGLFPDEAGPVDVNNLDIERRIRLSELMMGAFATTAEVLGFELIGGVFPVLALGYSIWIVSEPLQPSRWINSNFVAVNLILFW